MPRSTIWVLLRHPIEKVSDGEVTMSGEVIYLTAEEEDTHNIAQANAPLSDAGKFVNDKVKATV